MERLQKYLARAGVASRRKCEELIVASRVAINGETVSVLGTKVDPQQDRIEVDGEEDLAAIPAILMAPEGARVLYGMPGRGMVVVIVDSSARSKAKALLDLMEPREGWNNI